MDGELSALELGKTSDGESGGAISKTKESGLLMSEMRRWRDEMLTVSGAQRDELRWFFRETDAGALMRLRRPYLSISAMSHGSRPFDSGR